SEFRASRPGTVSARRSNPMSAIWHPRMGVNETRVRGGRLVAEGMKAAGVETVFALAGGHIMPTLDACVPLGVRVVDTRHEGAAALAAEGWALATGDPGCAIVTAGPGFTNSLTGLFDAGV